MVWLHSSFLGRLPKVDCRCDNQSCMIACNFEHVAPISRDIGNLNEMKAGVLHKIGYSGSYLCSSCVKYGCAAHFVVLRESCD